MDLQSFTLGIVSVMISALVGVVIFTFFRVQRFRKDIKYLNENLRGSHESLSKILEMERQETFRIFDDIRRDIDSVRLDLNVKDNNMSSHINHRFDKFENRLNSSCFKSGGDEKLYS
jgi:hypothetical protein